MKNKCINVKEASFPDFSAGEKENRDTSVDYTSLLMDVPLDVRVEIGKTKLRMCEVLSLAQGSIIRLEKQAGAPVDIIANKQTVARGDVIVIDDNFGVRITEIITSKKFVDDLMKSEEKTHEQNQDNTSEDSEEEYDSESDESEEHEENEE